MKCLHRSCRTCSGGLRAWRTGRATCRVGGEHRTERGTQTKPDMPSSVENRGKLLFLLGPHQTIECRFTKTNNCSTPLKNGFRSFEFFKQQHNKIQTKTKTSPFKENNKVFMKSQTIEGLLKTLEIHLKPIYARLQVQ